MKTPLSICFEKRPCFCFKKVNTPPIAKIIPAQPMATRKPTSMYPKIKPITAPPAVPAAQ